MLDGNVKGEEYGQRDDKDKDILEWVCLKAVLFDKNENTKPNPNQSVVDDMVDRIIEL